MAFNIEFEIGKREFGLSGSAAAATATLNQKAKRMSDATHQHKGQLGWVEA